MKYTHETEAWPLRRNGTIVVVIAGLCVVVIAAAAVMYGTGSRGDRASVPVPRRSSEHSADKADQRAAVEGNPAMGTDDHAPATTVIMGSEESLEALLGSMKAAYMAEQYVELDRLKGAALEIATQSDLPLVKRHFHDLVCGSFHRPDDRATLEIAVVDVLLEVWQPDRVSDPHGARILGQIMDYAYQILSENRYLEFSGSWTQQPRDASSLALQRQHFQRPHKDFDTVAVAYLIDSATVRYFSAEAYHDPMPLVRLFVSTEDYVRDRLSFAQSYTCELCVRLRARQHVPDLLQLSRAAKIQSVRQSALWAYLSLAGDEALIALPEAWLGSVEGDKVSYQVLSDLSAVSSSPLPVRTVYGLTSILFELLDSTGRGWDRYDEVVWDVDDARVAALAAERTELLQLLVEEFSPAMIAAWAPLLKRLYVNSDEAVVLQWAALALGRVVRGDVAIRAPTERIKVVYALVSLYRTVLGPQRKGEYVGVVARAYGEAQIGMLPALDETLLVEIPAGYGHEVQIRPMYAQLVPLLLKATARAMPRFDRFPTERERYILAWVTLQCPEAYEALAAALEAAGGQHTEQSFYLDVLIEWQEKANRFDSGE